MSVTSSDSSGSDRPTTPTWRYKAGLALFVVGNTIVIAGILAPVLGLASLLGAKTVAAIILGGEFLAMTSIAFIGKAGFLLLKSRIGSAAKSAYTAPVGRTRHYLSISLFPLNLAATYLIVWYAMVALSTVEAAGAEGVPVWGMNLFV